MLKVNIKLLLSCIRDKSFQLGFLETLDPDGNSGLQHFSVSLLGKHNNLGRV